MQITLPFAYVAKTIVGRKKNPQDLVYMDVVEADMPEVSGSAAPVVLRWDESTGPREVRYYDNGFYLPASKHPGEPSAFTAATLRDVDKIGEADAFSIALMLGHPIGTDGAWSDFVAYLGKTSKPPETSDIKTTVESGEAVARAHAQDVAFGLVAIDGVVWKRVHEPVLLVSQQKSSDAKAEELVLKVHTGGFAFGAPIDVDKKVFVQGTDKTMFFPLEDMAGAQAALAEFGTAYASEITGGYDVVMPGVFSFDPALDASVRTTQYAVAVFRKDIGKDSNDAIRSWIKVRDTLDEYRNTGDRSIAEHITAVLLPAFVEASLEKDTPKMAPVHHGLDNWENGRISIPSFGV